MIHTLPPLPYTLDALEPYISRETLEFHYGKHHQAYVDNLNKLIPGTEYENMNLEEIIKSALQGPIFNNAAQIWNHTFYFETLDQADETITPPAPGTNPFYDALTTKWGGGMEFVTAFNKVALTNFGSGWTWLVKNLDGELEIINTSNAQTPLTDNVTALLTCDVWEHAYYIDYRNARAKYLENFWRVVNWVKVTERYGA